MSMKSIGSVIVGVDGSRQAESAVRWAVREAVGRGLTLRLIYVVRTDLLGQMSAEQYRYAVDDAKSALDRARRAAKSRHDRTIVETVIAQGNPAAIFEAESTDASMICLGSSGIGRVGMAMLGSTAASVAEKARCPVAIVRSPNGSDTHDLQWVILPVKRSLDEALIGVAVEQARLLDHPVLAVGVWSPGIGVTPYELLDGLVEDWQQRFPDVHIRPVATDGSLRQFLRDNPDVGGVVVTDAKTADDVAALVGGEYDPSSPVERTVLVARTRSHEQSAASISVECRVE